MKQITDADVDQWAALYAEDLSLRAIGRIVKRDQATVGRALKRAGVQLRERGGGWHTCPHCGEMLRAGRGDG